MTNHARRESVVPIGALFRSPSTQAVKSRTMSPRKYTSTAATVPSWMIASNAAPGSGQPSSAGTMRRCAVELMGRNSVMPWTSPRTTARRRPM